MAYLRSGIDGGRQGGSLVRNRIMDIRGDLATGGRLVLSTTEPTVVDGNELGRIDFQAPLDTAGTDALLVGASIYAEADDTFAADNNSTELVFATGASEAAAEKMRITSDGKVGIGTATPVTDLTVEGPITIKEQAAADADTAGYGQIWVDDAANSPLMYTNDAGDDIGITTGSTMNAASLGGVLPVGVTGGSGLTALGTVASSGTINGQRLSDTGWVSLAPYLTNSWAQHSDGATYTIEYRKIGDCVHIRGIIDSGSGSMMTVPAAIRPNDNIYFSVQGESDAHSGSSTDDLYCSLTTAGVINKSGIIGSVWSAFSLVYFVN